MSTCSRGSGVESETLACNRSSSFPSPAFLIYGTRSDWCVAWPYSCFLRRVVDASAATEARRDLFKNCEYAQSVTPWTIVLPDHMVGHKRSSIDIKMGHCSPEKHVRALGSHACLELTLKHSRCVKAPVSDAFASSFDSAWHEVSTATMYGIRGPRGDQVWPYARSSVAALGYQIRRGMHSTRLPQASRSARRGMRKTAIATE
jgi:hypothetical protein